MKLDNCFSTQSENTCNIEFIRISLSVFTGDNLISVFYCAVTLNNMKVPFAYCYNISGRSCYFY